MSFFMKLAWIPKLSFQRIIRWTAQYIYCLDWLLFKHKSVPCLAVTDHIFTAQCFHSLQYSTYNMKRDLCYTNFDLKFIQDGAWTFNAQSHSHWRPPIRFESRYPSISFSWKNSFSDDVIDHLRCANSVFCILCWCYNFFLFTFFSASHNLFFFFTSLYNKINVKISRAHLFHTGTRKQTQCK